MLQIMGNRREPMVNPCEEALSCTRMPLAAFRPKAVGSVEHAIRLTATHQSATLQIVGGRDLVFYVVG
jgi:hypothetical protein